MILIGFGANLPFCGFSPAETLDFAHTAVARFCEVKARSNNYSSPAWPDPKDPSYTNGVSLIETDLSPTDLLLALHKVERSFGRDRSKVNAPRTLDLDLLAYGDLVFDGTDKEGLELPHPRLADRDFVLAPLQEVAPGWKHPVTGKNLEEMLSSLPERNAVRL